MLVLARGPEPHAHRVALQRLSLSARSEYRSTNLFAYEGTKLLLHPTLPFRVAKRRHVTKSPEEEARPLRSGTSEPASPKAAERTIKHSYCATRTHPFRAEVQIQHCADIDHIIKSDSQTSDRDNHTPSCIVERRETARGASPQQTW